MDKELQRVVHKNVTEHINKILPELPPGAYEICNIEQSPYMGRVDIEIFFNLSGIAISWCVAPFGEYNLPGDLCDDVTIIAPQGKLEQLRNISGINTLEKDKKIAKLEHKIAKLEYSPNPGIGYLAAMANFEQRQ